MDTISKEFIKNRLRNKVIVKFDIKKELPFKKARSKNASKNLNASIFIGWLKSVLSEYNSKNALAIYMNKKNIDYLDFYLPPMIFLAYSPMEDKTLKDDEYCIRLDKLGDNLVESNKS